MIRFHRISFFLRDLSVYWLYKSHKDDVRLERGPHFVIVLGQEEKDKESRQRNNKWIKVRPKGEY